jgi:serine/threonine protein kinase
MASETFDQKEKISLRVMAESADGDGTTEQSNSFAEAAVVVDAGTEPCNDIRTPGFVHSSALLNAPDFGCRFETLELIGEGGMGIVYKVRDISLKKQFAVKVLRSSLAADKQALKRFQREADAATKLNHPGLVAVYEQGVLADGTPFLVMDFVEGLNLAQVIETNGKIECERAIRIFDQVLEALEHVHASGLIHRDVKPRNIILSKTENGDDQIKLVDFGIARDTTHDGSITSGVTQTGDFLGSPFYMSPEQCQGLELEHRSDIYSSGCVLYEMLTGKTPFASPNPVKVVVGHISEKPTPPSSAVAEKHPHFVELDLIVLKCLEKSPDKRYQSTKRIREDLAACLDNRSPNRDRESTWRKQKILVGGVVIAAIFTSWFLTAFDAPAQFVWNTSEFLRPSAPWMLCASLASFVGLSMLISRIRAISSSNRVSKFLMVPMVASYLLLLPSYLLLDTAHLNSELFIPYVIAVACASLVAVFYGIKYAVFPKQTFLAPVLEYTGRVLTDLEKKQLVAFQKASLSLSLAGALLFKAPPFPPFAQTGTLMSSVVLMTILIFFTSKIYSRVKRIEATKPGDRWLLFSSISTTVAALGYGLNGLARYLSDSFMVTMDVATKFDSITTVMTYAPLVIAIVFAAVWWSRRHAITPFGKSDGW